MDHDIKLIYSIADRKFVQTLARSLERQNISVDYKECLPATITRRSEVNEVKKIITKGLARSYFGVIVISPDFLKEQIENMSDLCETLISEVQFLHPVWVNLSKKDLSYWDPHLLSCGGIWSPPETSDSIARQISLKLAGDIKLQKKVFVGEHPQIQYLPPKIQTYQKSEVSTLYNDSRCLCAKSMHQVDTNEKLDSNRNENDIEELSGREETLDTVNDMFHTSANDDVPISHMFHPSLYQAVCKRFNNYLTNLSNWEDLARSFNISNKEYFEYLCKSCNPTSGLLEELMQRNVTVSQFKDACKRIQRNDVIDEINRYYFNDMHDEEQHKYIRD